MTMYEDVLSQASVTLAIAAGTSTVTVIPAPGVGSRIRLVSYTLTVNRAVPATGADLSLRWITALTIPARAQGLSFNGQTEASKLYPGPGVQGADNDGLEFVIVAGAAGGSGFAIVEYFLDDKT